MARSLHRGKPAAGRARASGRFVLRIDPALHEELRIAARDCGLSLNDYCARRLATPSAGCQIGDATGAVRRALRMFPNRLLGVVVFGSWARGEARPASDVDLLVVLEDAVSLTRDVYRMWDEAPMTWDGHPIEPHFVHPPRPNDVTGGVWAEAALDGLVLFERSMAVSRALAAVRHHILSGRLVRRLVHGQPYWAEVA